MRKIAALAATAFLSFTLPVKADGSLYQALGGKDGLHRIVAKSMVYYLADPRIKDTFAESNIERVEQMIELQFCALAGGPCTYTGHSMEEAHKGLRLQDKDFAALVEDLQQAMDDEKVPFTVQNRLLALLAPMHRDVVTR
jgi:hemoglobin